MFTDMFTHTIKNPNGIEITQKDYHVIPFGHRCCSGLICKYASVRHFSLPFDWNERLFPGKIKAILEKNFEDYIPDVDNGVFTNKYGVMFPHFNKKNIKKG
jgi:hypothetical protein